LKLEIGKIKNLFGLFSVHKFAQVFGFNKESQI